MRKPLAVLVCLVIIFLMMMALGVVGCGGGSFPPKPPSSPTPGPTPTPPPPTPVPVYKPITISGRTFMQGGQPLDMRAIVPCCELAEKWGWPRGNETFIRDAARLGANVVEVRLGPYGVEGETRLDDVSALLPVNPTQVNLDIYYEPYWAKTDKFVELAKTFGITVIFDVDDGWAMRTQNWSAFNKGANIQNIDEAHCDITRQPITPRHASWVRNAAQRLAKHTNIMFHISNEVMLCKPERVWEQGIANLLRQHAPGKLIGSNANEPWSLEVADYVSFHSGVAPSPRTKPAVVNETADKVTSPESYCNAYLEARRQGTYFMLWAGNRSMAEVEASTACWKKPLPPPDQGDDIGWDGDLPYLKACGTGAITMPEPAGIKCICSKQSGPCPPGMKEDATGGHMSSDLKNSSHAGVGPNNRIDNVPAYMVSVLRAAQAKGYCAKYSSWDEIFVKVPNGPKSYGLDTIHDPATGGRFVGTFKNVAQCFPAAL